MIEKDPRPPSQIEAKLDDLLQAIQPEASFARRLRAELLEKAVSAPRKAPWPGRMRWQHAWQWGLGLAGLALLVGVLVFSIGLLPETSLSPAGTPSVQAVLPAPDESPTPVPTPASVVTGLPVRQNPLPEFPLEVGTTWVYTYVPYEPLPSDPTQIITATYSLTETVVQVKSVPPYYVAKVETESVLVAKPPDWGQDELSGSGAFWYVIDGDKIYKGSQELDLSSFNPDLSPGWQLAYRLPLSIGQSWCPVKYDFKSPGHPEIKDCSGWGERAVVQALAYQSAAGNFDDCYQITESINSGGTTRWFCNGVGVVAASYDHAGSRFGFEQRLVKFSAGSVQAAAVETRPSPSSPDTPTPGADDGVERIASADGRWTAILDRKAGSLEVVDPQGIQDSLFPPGSTASAASWSPDGQQLAIVLSNWPEKAPASAAKGVPEIWLAAVAGDTIGAPARLYQPQEQADSSAASGQPGQILLGSWSPEGRRFVFWLGPLSASIAADGLPLWSLEVPSGQATRLSQVALMNPAYQSWAPDGSALAFTDGGYRSAQVQKWLSRYEVSTGQVTTLVPQEKQVPGTLAWSPQGDWIAYAAVEAGQTSSDLADWMSWDNSAILRRRIYLLDVQSGSYHLLNQAEAYQDAPRWSADGKTLYYVQMDGDQARLMAANPASGTAEALSGCSAPLPSTAGYYGQVDWGSLYAACPDTRTPIPTPTSPTAPGFTETPGGLSLASPHDEIHQRIISPTWGTLWLQGQAKLTSSTGVQQNLYVQAWLEREGAGRVLSTDQISGNWGFNLDMLPRWAWISDGQKLSLFDLKTGQFDPSTANQRWSVHPLESAGQVMGMFFPTYLAARSEDLQVVEMSEQAGRPALVVDWAYFRLWVDAQSGVLLRQQTRGEDGQVSQDTFLSAIAYDLPLPTSGLSTENLEQSRFEPPPNREILPALPALDPGSYSPSGPGEAYFELSGEPPFQWRMAVLPAGCLASGLSCSDLQEIPERPRPQLHLNWSHAGHTAVYADTNFDQLWAFDTLTHQWRMATKGGYQMRLTWSQDDRRLAAVTVESDPANMNLAWIDSQDWSVHPIPTSLKGNKEVIAWLDEDGLAVTVLPDSFKGGKLDWIAEFQPGLYRVNIETGEFELVQAWNEASYYSPDFLSPDGRYFLGVEAVQGQASLALADPDFQAVRPLNISGSPLGWQPSAEAVLSTPGEPDAASGTGSN